MGNKTKRLIEESMTIRGRIRSPDADILANSVIKECLDVIDSLICMPSYTKDSELHAAELKALAEAKESIKKHFGINE